MNPCDSFRESLLAFDWDAADRQRATEVIRHLESCPACAAAARDYEGLRDLLNQGAKADPHGGWIGLQRRLDVAVHPPKPRWIRPLLSIAAALLLAAGIFSAGRLSIQSNVPDLAINHPAPSSVSPAPETASLKPTEIAHQVAAFTQVSSAFDRRASWLLLSDTSSDVGLGDQAIESHRKLLVLKLKVLHAGAAVSDADLAIVPGQTAKLSLPVEGGKLAQYRISTSTDEPTRLSIFMELKDTASNETLAELATSLRVKAGEPIDAGDMMTSSGTYELKIAFWRSELAATEP
jgi:hypothetical protein